MAYYTQEQIEKAREMDLLTYLRNYEPQELVHVTGKTYCTREHDSLKIYHSALFLRIRFSSGLEFSHQKC